MTTLANFPMISQLTTITSDGLPNRDAQFECVSTAILAGVMWLLGVTQLGGKFTPDYFKDTAYGETFYGGTSASAYVGLCASLGVALFPVNGIPATLVSESHKRIQAGNPVVFTEPDPYVSQSLNWSHVCVFYAEEQGFLTALDPYIGRPIRRTDDEWTRLLLDNQIWLLAKEDEIKTIEITDPEIARYFELAVPDGSAWRCRSNGKIIKDAMLTFYCSFGNSELCGLTYLGLPQSNEIPMDAKGNTKQYWECGVTFYDPKHTYDTRPGTSNPDTRPVYLAHLYSANSPAQDPRVAQLQTQLAQCQSGNLNGADAGAAAKLAQVRAIVG